MGNAVRDEIVIPLNYYREVEEEGGEVEREIDREKLGIALILFSGLGPFLESRKKIQSERECEQERML